MARAASQHPKLAIGHNLKQFRVSLKYYLWCILISCCIAVILTACLPLPTTKQALDIQAITFEIEADDILRETMYVQGFQEAHTPSEYNRSLVAKFTRPHVATNKPKTIVVMMPGIYAGITSLELLAKQMIAAQSGVEVWIIDRRSNLLEDVDVFHKSIALQDATLAYDYYVKNYGKESGYLPPDPADIAFMEYWGLELHLADLHAVIQQAVTESEHVYLLGHSLGATMASYYAAFQVDEVHVGEDYIDGLILLDGVLGRTGGFGGIQWFDGLLDIAPNSEASGLVDLQTLTGFKTYIPLNTENFVRRESAALLASLEPEALSPLHDFPITNRAALGALFDDSFEQSTAFSISMGDVQDATLAGNIVAFVLDGAIGAYSKSLEGVSTDAEKVSWDATLGNKEVCDIDSFAKAYNNLDTNFHEWYFPVELMLDIASYDMTLENESGFIKTSEVDVPTLAIGAGRGLVQNYDTFSAYANLRTGDLLSMTIIDGFTHGDILCAEVNPATVIVLGWLEQLNSIRNNR